MRQLGLVLALGGLLAGYVAALRPRVLTWGASAEGAAAALPGDDVLAAADLQTTRATTVDAGPATIWPWLVQMGPRLHLRLDRAPPRHRH